MLLPCGAYCLDPHHPRGKHKARVFFSALGLTSADAELLRDQLATAAHAGFSVPGSFDEFGTRYTIDFRMTCGSRQATVRSAWIILRGENNPRLTSCYVLLD